MSIFLEIPEAHREWFFNMIVIPKIGGEFRPWSLMFI